ncbi:hypothetical protein EYS14_23205 [Alteromonadaceae bacterium M269]|nr:hypothetical protein EYS14_23205 [Alteromonadaceae bacterium M269]
MDTMKTVFVALVLIFNIYLMINTRVHAYKNYPLPIKVLTWVMAGMCLLYLVSESIIPINILNNKTGDFITFLIMAMCFGAQSIHVYLHKKNLDKSK